MKAQEWHPIFRRYCRITAAGVSQCSCFCKQLQGSLEVFAEILREIITLQNFQGTNFSLICLQHLAQKMIERGHFLFPWCDHHLLLLLFRVVWLLSSYISFTVNVWRSSTSGESKILSCYLPRCWQTSIFCATLWPVLESDLICHSKVFSSRSISRATDHFYLFFTTVLLETIPNFSSKRGKYDGMVLITEVKVVSAFPLYKPLFWRVSNSLIKIQSRLETGKLSLCMGCFSLNKNIKKNVCLIAFVFLKSLKELSSYTWNALYMLARSIFRDAECF